MSRFISLFVCLSLAVSMVACVTAPQAVPVPNLTVALNIRDSGNENTTEHHGHDETKTWTIGVIDSPNTINAMAYLQNYKQAILGASNFGVYNDVNVEYLKSNISARLKKAWWRQSRFLNEGVYGLAASAGLLFARTRSRLRLDGARRRMHRL